MFSDIFKPEATSSSHWDKGFANLLSTLASSCFNNVISCCADNRLPIVHTEVQQRKLLLMGLYLLIWGEAANLRFMPECLCYIYHHSLKIVSCVSIYTDNKPPAKDPWVGKVNFVEIRSYWHIFRSFDRMWCFFILCLQVYFMDTQIWYAIFYTIFGGVYGAFNRLGEIQNLGTLRSRFLFLPGAINFCLIPPEKRKKGLATSLSHNFSTLPSNKEKEARFAQIWNKIITSLRGEDLINNREMNLLLAPQFVDRELDLIQWPLFLLAGKIAQACKPVVKMAGLWESVRAVARGYEIVMGLIVFTPVALIARLPFVSEFQTHMLFGQAFNRGLQISRIHNGRRKDSSARDD
ncbi:hypothetical protein R6Q59_014734 [Mikania micrantha]